MSVAVTEVGLKFNNQSQSFAAVRAEMAGRIADAPVEWLPFPHMIVPSFFPQPIYDDILARNPFEMTAGAEWISAEDAAKLKSDTPYWKRRQLNLHEPIPHVDETTAGFWSFLHELLSEGGWFSRQLDARFGPYLDMRFGPLRQGAGLANHLFSESFLQVHEDGYFIGPHTDIPTRVLTCIFSFASETGYEASGTQLLTPRDPTARCSGRTHHSWDGFDLVKTAPYTPNSLFIFAKTQHSFHAVQKMDPTPPNGRFGMQVQIYEKDGGIFHDLSGWGDSALFHTR